jgi:site-specific DNA-methyltransferase (adenine-specific)
MKQIKEENYTLILGDNLQSMKTMEDNSIDSVVTDPPYGLAFMGKKWDYDVPSVEFWREVYRILKPGGHILSFGGTRTYHRLVTAIEDSGFEIKDQLQWIYGSGFPKSHNIGKAIDKRQGNKRSVLGSKTSGIAKSFTKNGWGSGNEKVEITKGNSQWEGWGSSLKPANEPICLARKPLSERTIAENVMKWGTGGINIDDCRIPFESSKDEHHQENIRKGKGTFFGGNGISKTECNITQGRFPSNVFFDQDASEQLNEQADASKFFYCPKVSKKERDMGLEDFDDKAQRTTNGGSRDFNARCANCGKKFIGSPNLICSCDNPITDNQVFKKKNIHPTVKPINLMTYLVKLITPIGGTVLDPFMGSGSGGIATLLEGFKFVGMEQDPEYFEIATARIKEYESYREILTKPKKTKREKIIVEKDLEIGEPVMTFWLNQAV